MFNRRKRKLRPSFLLHLTVLFACMAAFVAVIYFLTFGPISIGLIVFLIVFWLFGIEAGILPEVICHFIAKKASDSDEPLSSIWFVDTTSSAKKVREQALEDSKDNPTFR